MLVPLVPYLIDWRPIDSIAPPAAYLHFGTVYLTGAIGNRRGHAVGSTIFAGLPSTLRPAADAHFVMPILPELTTDACNPFLNLPLYWHATAHPDGTVTLDEAPPGALNAPPSIAEWFYDVEYEGPTKPGTYHRYAQYLLPFSVALVLGNSSWPVTPTADEPAFSALAADLGADFADSESKFAVHGTRIHLGGGVTANKDQAEELLAALPPDSEEAAGDVTTAVHAAKPVPLRIEPPKLYVASDEPIVPATDSPPLRYMPNRLTHGAVLLMPGSDAWPTGEEAEGEEPTGEKVTDLPSEPKEAGVGELGVYVAKLAGYTVCDWGSVYEPEYDKEGKLIKYECASHPFSMNCGLAVEEPIAIDLDIAAVLGMCHPEPDWFLLTLFVRARWGYGPFIESFPPPPLACKKSPCGSAGCEFGLAYHPKIGGKAPGVPLVEGGIEAPPLYDLGGAETPEVAGHRDVTLEGYLAPPVSHYVGETHLPGVGHGVAPGLLWIPSQAAIITVTLGASYANISTLHGSMKITPFYERRQMGLHNGDALDLTHTGWEAGEEAEAEEAEKTPPGIAGRQTGVVRLSSRDT